MTDSKNTFKVLADKTTRKRSLGGQYKQCWDGFLKKNVE